MFGSIGFPELLLIFIIALLLFGPRKLPEIGRSIGRALGEFRRASNDLKRTIEEEVATEDLRQTGREIRDAMTLQPPPAPPVDEARAAQVVGLPEAGTVTPDAKVAAPDAKIEPK